MKTKWRLFFVAALMPVAGAANASTPLSAVVQSPASFDEALRGGNVRLVSNLEPAPAQAAPPASMTHASAMGASSACGCNLGCGDGCCDDGCCDDGCCDSCCDDCCDCGPVWTVRAGAVVLTRDDPDGRILIRNRAVGQATIAKADIFDFDWAVGPDMTIARWFAGGTGIEGRYFGALQWESAASVTTPIAWDINMAPALNLNGIVDVNANYISRLDSAEINWRGGPNQTLALLAGFRWIELHETVGVNVTAGPNSGSAYWDTNNHLYGGQLGAILQLLRDRGPFTADIWFKGGIYGNDADNQVNLNLNGNPIIDNHTQKGDVTFVGDIALTGSYWFNDVVSFRSGYQLFWLDGVALASDQITSTSSLTGNGVFTDGDVLYHGAMFSLDFVW